MQLVDATGFCVAPFVSMAGPGKYLLTVLVKGTFDLLPGGAARPAAEQLFPTGDEPFPDDEEGTGSIRYASDFAQFKPRADLLVAGTCHVPGGAPTAWCRVSLRVGTVEKSLTVTGDRRRRWAVDLGGATAPEQFVQMPLRYERSYGGAGYDRNPIGIGHAEVLDESGERYRPLPNVETESGQAEPGGFGAVPMTWPPRAEALSAATYKGRWLRERWPGFPDDFDWGFFNAAPRDQQVEGYLRGDEELCFENLHPVHPQLRSRLPGLRVRCFRTRAEGPEGARAPFEEIPMRLDTLWAQPDAERLVLVWRGRTAVDSTDCGDVACLYTAEESLAEPPGTLDYHRLELERRLATSGAEELEPEAAPDATGGVDLEAELAEAEAIFQEECRKAGIDPVHPPEPDEETKRLEARILGALGTELPGAAPALTRELVQERYARGEGFAGEDLRGLNLAALDLSGGQLAGALLGGARLGGCRLAGADLSGAELVDADLARADLGGANLSAVDLTGARLEEANLARAVLDGALLDGAHCRGAVLTGASAVGALFIGADLAGAGLGRAVLRDADLSEATLDGAVLADADLSEACLVRARGAGADFSRAVLERVRGAEARLPRSILVQARAADSVWEGAELTGADLRFARLDGCDFTGAALAEAALGAVSAKGARFAKARLAGVDAQAGNFFEGSFEGADLDGADFRGASLYGAEFLEARVEQARFEEANLNATKLERG